MGALEIVDLDNELRLFSIDQHILNDVHLRTFVVLCTMDKKLLHPKRSTNSKHPSNMHAHTAPLDSPAYDASEEDNDPLTDDGSVSLATTSRNSRMAGASTRNSTGPSARARHALASSLVSSDEGVDSPTYDGDIESSTTQGPGDVPHTRNHHHHHSSSIASTLSPSTPAAHLPVDPAISTKLPELHTRPPHSSVPRPTPSHPSRPIEPPPASISTAAFNPANLTPEHIQEFVRTTIAGPGIAVGTGPDKKVYKINEQPRWRPVRIYADGVYDLFHFGHALQLRQAKLSFPSVPPRSTPTGTPSGSTPSLDSSYASADSEASAGQGDTDPNTPGVYLLVGVNSDQQCMEHKSKTVMSHAERCESVRHCRWVDEVVPDAPWVIDQEFLDKYKIDYVAHDEDPYGSAGHDDVYAYCKSQGKFLPTRRTPGISTSDLLARLVSGYRHRAWDKKLEKMGLRQLMAEGSDWDESRVGSRAVSTDVSREGSRAHSPVHEE
ncbi:hypothetical protein BXZ70DRAFT_957348 [Cristinia sonorae]|uniref:choline-phosphate cytidylyltransferase n=1 Tax=Cristinia sonorae TaxID=1940300 RepID=A0A8K0UG35_9AGAR|nr:hypothetical protein BXZ70DRAFT_957348 [Cristinia sonorae]